MATQEEIDNLARYLVNDFRKVDALLNEGCDPYDDWDHASLGLKNSARTKARHILEGKVHG